MIVDKLGQELFVGDWVVSAAPSYGSGILIVGLITKFTDKGNVSIKPISFHNSKFMSVTSHSLPQNRMLKLTNTQLDALNIKLDMAHATTT